MARLIGPDESVRAVYLTAGTDRGKYAAQGMSVPLYADEALTVAADVRDEDGGTIPGTPPTLTVDAYSRIPLFQYPDGVDVVYTSINGGPAVALYARTDDRIDAVAAAVTALDAAAVHKTGAETIAGVKTFSGSLLVPTPSGGTAAANRQYVDDQIAALSGVYVPGTEVPSLEELAGGATLGTVSATSTVYLAPIPLAQRVASMLLASTTSIAASDTDYWTVKLVRIRAGSSNTLVVKHTRSSGGEAVTAGQAWTFDLSVWSNVRYVEAGDILALVFTATGVPAPWTGAVASWRYEPGVVAGTPVAAGIVADNFNRADSTTSMGSTSTGGLPWTPLRGTWGISSNRAYVATSQARNYVVVDCGHYDVSVSVKVPVAQADGGVAIRMTVAGSLVTGITANLSGLYQEVSNTLTQIATFSSSFANGDLMTIKAVGSAITVYKNGAQVGSATNSTNLTATSHGLRDSVGTTARFDDFAVAVDT